jgi:hypothetical protein
MIRKQDIQRAISIFKEWDNNRKWDIPNPLFISHTLKKAEDSLNTANALLNIMQNSVLKEQSLPKKDYNASLWIINASYYSMFFLAQVILGKDKKKLPEGTPDTHKTILLAILYYFIIKGSGLEGKKNIGWEDIKSSRMSNALIIFQDAQEEAEKLLHVKRAKEAVDSLEIELDKRTELTYRSTKEAELAYAKASVDRAKKFWEIVKEYIQTIG